jgi:hypothetical protein
MTGRTRGALAALLVTLGFACATSGDSGAGDGFPDSGSADSSTGGQDGPGGPSPDAVVLGDDATGDDAAEVDDSPAGKSCAGLPDGTPCGASPDVCHDAPQCESGVCAPAAAKMDGFVCGTPADACHGDPTCKTGVCAPVNKPDGTDCASAPDLCHTPGTCTAGKCGAVGTQPDSYNWQAGDGTARCCGGKPVHTNTDSNCGVCGIQCNASNGESCQTLGGEWFCRGCVASAACWSHCCSESFSPYSCAASDCAGNCDSAVCPAGSHCVSGGTTSSDYCSY